ncbi:hypothetical protein [Brevibacterium sp.]|nr:hypothetical protein [Brevibacterium sp.]MDN6159408.1 hypothetical protein [Brevibacterium sp.]MDN6604708.1 hypothetical protein [Brevibacterium sp.]MDN6668156.1 hypothetical protein [Brevibacterium sp.]
MAAVVHRLSNAAVSYFDSRAPAIVAATIVFANSGFVTGRQRTGMP